MTASPQSSSGPVVSHGSTSLSARRIQYRVGHGGFHATIVNPTGAPEHRLTYVYDVGAKPDKSGYLMPAIGAFIGELDKFGITRVDYVVLSHIDEDHVNGLHELLDALGGHDPVIAVRSVVLPWLSSAQKLLTQRRNNHRQPGTAVTNLAGPDQAADAYLRELGVETVVRIVSEGEDPAPDSISNARMEGVALPAPMPGRWLMLPIKTPTPAGLEAAFRSRLRAALKPAGLDPDDFGDHSQILVAHRSAIKTAMVDALTAYNKAERAKGGTLIKVGVKDLTNWSSLALLHGSSAPSATCSVSRTGAHAEADCVHGWLHTGDLPLKKSQVWTHMEAQLKKVAIASPLCAVLAPHHGSDNNHISELYTLTCPGTVVLTTGRVMRNGRRRGWHSYGLTTAGATTSVHPAAVIDLHNIV